MVAGIGLPGLRTGLCDWAGSSPSKPAPAGSSLAALGASSETDAQITIKTAEGDTVAITLDSQIDATYAFYSRPGTEGATGLRAEVLTASASREVSISVQGDLNEQERADISSLVKQLERVIRSFLKGNTNAAIQQAIGGPSLDSLAGYALNIEHTDSLALIEATGGANPDATTTGTVSQPAVLPMPASPAVDEGDAVAPPPVATPGAENPLGRPSPAAQDVLDQIARAAKDSGVDLAKSGGMLMRMLRKLLHQMRREAGMKSFRPLLAEVSSRLPRHLQDSNLTARDREAR
jgi:hypothetical protein